MGRETHRLFSYAVARSKGVATKVDGWQYRSRLKIIT